MYNLIVTSDTKAWTRSSHALERSRFGEYTPEPLKIRYGRIDQQAIVELLSLPTLFAYERPHKMPARIGKLSRIAEGTLGTIRLDFEFMNEIPPIPSDRLDELAVELDIVEYEMNRTHWAVKDVDVWEVLRKAGMANSSGDMSATDGGLMSSMPHDAQIVVTPTVFKIPSKEQDARLVALMMPFSADFDSVAETVREACAEIGLLCERADDGWQESTIIQEVFNLIYRCSAVVVDLSGGNSNVMYETGIAHTLGRPVVPISQHDVRLPFDLSHHRTLFYLKNGEGLKEMKGALAKRLRTIMQHSQSRTKRAL